MAQRTTYSFTTDTVPWCELVRTSFPLLILLSGKRSMVIDRLDSWNLRRTKNTTRVRIANPPSSMRTRNTTGISAGFSLMAFPISL